VVVAPVVLAPEVDEVVLEGGAPELSGVSPTIIASAASK